MRDGQPALLRIPQTITALNEGPTQVMNIQMQLGRRPIFAAGNSVGDRPMLEYTLASGEPSLALLINHDDAEREYAYESTALTMSEAEPIVAVGHRLGWAVVSMRDDWSTVFPTSLGPR